MDLYMYKSGSMLETVLARAMRKKLPRIIASEAWLWVSRSVIMKLLEDTNLKVTEQLFTGIVKWCRANSDSELKAIDHFRFYFEAKLIGENPKEKMPEILTSEAWLWLSESLIMELMEETKLEVTDTQMFNGIVRWYRANTDTEQEAKDKFQHSFGDKIVSMNTKEKFPDLMASEAWLWLPESLILELVEDTNLNVTEGKLFTGIIKWCRANSETEQEAIDKFKNCFADTIFGKNISRWQWLDLFLPLDIFIFIPDKQFRQWSSKIVTKNNCKEATQLNHIETSA